MSFLKDLFGPPDVGKLKTKGDVKSLIKALSYQKDASVRQSAAIALGELKNAQAVGSLVAALKDESGAVCEAAVEALGEIGDPRVVEPLIATLRDEDRRDAAIKALGKVGAPAVEPLVATLKDKNEDTRGAAADALRQLTVQLDDTALLAREVEPLAAYWVAERQWDRCVEIGAPAVGPLTAALRDEDSDARQSAAGVLGRIGDARAVEPLVATLGDTEADVRKVSAEALGKIGDTRAVGPLVEALKDKQGNVRQAAAEMLDKLGWQPDRRDSGAFYWISKGLLKFCVEIGMPAVEPLIATLKNPNRKTCIAAAMALGQIGDTRAVQPLITVLEDRDSDVRRAAARALGQIGDNRAVDPLLVLLENRRCREAAAEALGQIGDKRAVELLIAILEHKDKFARMGAAEALGKIGDTLAVEPLIATLNKTEDWDEKKAYIKVLGQFSDVRAVEPLIAAVKKALEDKDSYLLSAGIEALEQFDDVRVVDPLKSIFYKVPDLRQAAAEVLKNHNWEPTQRNAQVVFWLAIGQEDKCVEMGAPAVEPLIAYLKDKYIGPAAALALTKIGTPALESLIIAYESPKESHIRSVLGTIVGLDFGHDPALWRQWWGASQKERILIAISRLLKEKDRILAGISRAEEVDRKAVEHLWETEEHWSGASDDESARWAIGVAKQAVENRGKRAAALREDLAAVDAKLRQLYDELATLPSGGADD